MEQSRRKRTTYERAFKESAARLVIEQSMTRAKVARDLGVDQNLIGKWVKEFSTKQDDAFPGNGKLSGKDQKIKDLEKQVKVLQMEREILKKATAFFVNHGG